MDLEHILTSAPWVGLVFWIGMLMVVFAFISRLLKRLQNQKYFEDLADRALLESFERAQAEDQKSKPDVAA